MRRRGALQPDFDRPLASPRFLRQPNKPGKHLTSGSDPRILGPMNILSGAIPDHKAWRSLVVMSPDDSPGATWDLSLLLARAYGGEMMAAVVCNNISGATYNKAEALLATCMKRVEESDTVIPLIIATDNFGASMRTLVSNGDVDVLVLSAEGAEWHSLDRIPCTIMAIRGEQYENFRTAEDEVSNRPQLERFLVPTSGGPPTAAALNVLSKLAPAIAVTAFYVARADQGENGIALGKARLRQMLNYVDAGDVIDTRVVSADSAIEGITTEASGEYDLVFVGTSGESSLDRALFGDIVGEVIRRSKTPVVVVREASNHAVGNLLREVSWLLQRVLPRLNVSERTAAYVRIRRNARPDIDFYILITLSAIIAAFGLLLSSPAVVIGAMLVAPLMSPIVGVGMAIVLGDSRFLNKALQAVVRGVGLALAVGVLIGLLPYGGGADARNHGSHPAYPAGPGSRPLFRRRRRLRALQVGGGGRPAGRSHRRGAGPTAGLQRDCILGRLFCRRLWRAIALHDQLYRHQLRRSAGLHYSRVSAHGRAKRAPRRAAA